MEAAQQKDRRHVTSVIVTKCSSIWLSRCANFNKNYNKSIATYASSSVSLHWKENQDAGKKKSPKLVFNLEQTELFDKLYKNN